VKSFLRKIKARGTAFLGRASQQEADLTNREAAASEPQGFAASRILPIATALVLVALATGALFVLQGFFALLNLVSIVYLIPVVIAAMRWGMLPAIVAAVAGAAAADFLFYPPVFSFWIEDTQNIADLVVFLIVALVTSHLAALLKREAISLRRREGEIRELYAFSKRLAGCFTTTDLIRATQDYLSECLGRPTLLIGSEDILAGSFGADVPDAVRTAVTEITVGNALPTKTVVENLTARAWRVRGVSLGTARYVVVVDLGSDEHRVAGVIDRRVDAALEEAAMTLGRLDVAKVIERARVEAQASALKDALIGTMSHDFRNPLASILGAASVLDEMPGIKADDRARSLVGTVHDQAARLASEVQSLFDAARMTAPGAQPERQWTDPIDIINAAVEHRRPQLAAHHVELSVAADLPLIKVHSALVEHALGQLLENAAKYSPAGSTIKVAASLEQTHVALSVSDQGVGLTDDEKRRVGQRSFRGGRHLASVPGAGLGLWIANNFIAADRGTLEAQSAGAGLGTTMTIRLPVTPKEPSDVGDAVA
jgi:K+-sensing histidine kinase KdpD